MAAKPAGIIGKQVFTNPIMNFKNKWFLKGLAAFAAHIAPAFFDMPLVIVHQLVGGHFDSRQNEDVPLFAPIRYFDFYFHAELT